MIGGSLGFFYSLKFLTILPAPVGRDPSSEQIGRSLTYFPLVGLLIGALLVGFDHLFSLALPASLSSALVITVLIVLTGALHIDGFIDTCDGAFVKSTPDERLRIMSDSHAGSFGVVGAVALFLTKYLALLAVPAGLRNEALLLMPLLGRWAMVLAVAAFPYARQAGKGLVFKGQATWQRTATAGGIGLVLAVLVAGISGLALALSVTIVALLAGRFLQSRLGGLTGDSYGAINELSEVVALIVLPLLAGVLGGQFSGVWDSLVA